MPMPKYAPSDCVCVSLCVSLPLISLLLCCGRCSPDRSYALAGSWDGALYIWNVDTGRLENSLRGPHCAAVNAVAWCYSGSHVASVDQARKVVLWH